MSPKEQEWLDLYMETGDAQEAVRQVFNCNNDNSIVSRASQLKAKHADEVDKRLRDSFKRNAVQAHKIINDLAKSSTNEQVRLKACQDILSRAGHDAAHRVEHVDKESTREELEARLKAVLSGLDKEMLVEILGEGNQVQQMLSKALETTH